MAKHPNYELFEELGRGDNSVVYRAYDLVLGRDVAIKELTSEPGSDGGQSDARRTQQFLKEAGFLAQFEHENVLRIHTVDQDRGWIVMELMKGTLASQITSEPMSPDTVRSVLRQMLTALVFLHQKDKVHGAVRPTNILINEHGTVKLSDFEASSRDGELRAPTGSKKYLAPELIRSDFGDFGPAVDLYCLGFTALELLTGRKFDSLFPGTGEGAIDADVAWLRWHSSAEPMRPVSELASNVPADLTQVLDSLLKKSVPERSQSAAEVLQQLDDGPLVPVEVPAAAPKAATQQDPAAILPTNAVKLRESPPRKRTGAATKPVPAKKGKDRLNEIIGKPFVLWPLCVGILAAAMFVGLQLRGNKTQPPVPIVEDFDPPTVDPEEPTAPGSEPSLVAVTLNVLPESMGVQLLVDGEPRALDNLHVEPGEHAVVVHKEGYESFESTLAIGANSSTFEITLKAVPETKLVAEKGDKNAPEPQFIEIRVDVFPTDAEVLIEGKPANVKDGVIRLTKDESTNFELSARREGYKPRTATWSWDELLASDYGVQLSLDKIKAPPVTPAIALPDSLIPKPGADRDDTTKLPTRALVRALQETAPLEVALVHAGVYPFGVPAGEARTWELAAQQFELATPFYIGVEEVNNAQYAVFAEATGNFDSADASPPRMPLTNVSVRQSAMFCKWAGGRLPTEQEWEAAVRGPQDAGYPLPWGEGELSEDRCRLFRGEPDNDLSPVETQALPASANSIGLHNTIGNVSEWCDTEHSDGEFIIKGGSYRMPPGDHIRATWRGRSNWRGAADIGLRLLVPVSDEPHNSAALAFAVPTNIDEVLRDNEGNNKSPVLEEQSKTAYTKTVQEIAAEFTGPAELVIDSGGFMDEVTDIKFSPNGQLVAVGGGKVVRIWDVQTGELVETLRGDMSRTSYGNVNAVAWSPDSQFLLVGVSDYRKHGNIRVYKTASLDEIHELIDGHNAPCRKLCFSRDGRHLASVDADGLILVRDWDTRETISRIPARNREQPIYDAMAFPTNEPFLLGVDFEGPQVFAAVDGKRLSASDNMPARVRGWLIDIFNKLVPMPYGNKTEPRVVDFQMDSGRWAGAGNTIVDGRSRFWVRLWESREPVSSATPARELAAYDQHRWTITALALQPGGSLVASGDKFGEVHVWDSATGERLYKFAGQGQPIYEVAFDAESTRIAFGTKPHVPGVWGRNNYGTATRVLDLHQRTIFDADSREDLQLLGEQPSLGQSAVSVRRQDAFYFVERKSGSEVQSRYRLSSGRSPTVFTLLDEQKLGVEQPVIFGDNEGLLALWDSATDELKRAYIGHGGLVSAISPASNGKLIASSSTDRTIRLWTLEDYIPTGIFDFKFENSAVREVVPGSSSEKAGVQIGDRIVSIDNKSLTEMFELMLLNKFNYKPGEVVPVQMKRGDQTYDYDMTMEAGYDFSEPVLNFYMGNDGQWIIWHPHGYYDASPGADRLIGWHLNRGPNKSAAFFEVQQFRKTLYRPDIIDGILETGSLKAALAQVDDSKYEKEFVDFRDPEQIAENHPPSVQITYPTHGWKTETPKVTVKGEAYSINGLPLTALTLLHNGSVAKVFRPTKVNQTAMLVEHQVELEPGSNDLVLIAANAKSSSQGEHIVVQLTGQSSVSQPNAIVLAIGVSEFEGSLPELSNAADDAKAFVTTMKAHQDGQLYANVQTRLLTGKVAHTEILDGFQWLSENTKDGDVVMLFVASHGLVDRRSNFYVGASNSVETRARSTAVSWRDLTDTLQLDLPDCKRMVFLDLRPTRAAQQPGMRSPLLDLAAPEMGTVFLSSNTLQQEPAKTTGDIGPFLQAVLDTVGNKAFDTNPNPGDSLFNPVELAAGVTSRVKDLTRDQQQPVFFSPQFTKFTNVLELRK